MTAESHRIRRWNTEERGTRLIRDSLIKLVPENGSTIILGKLMEYKIRDGGAPVL